MGDAHDGPPAVGVVVPVFRGRRFLRDTLEGVRAQAPDIPRAVIVVEDGTPPGEDARDIVAAYPEVRYERLSENRGVFFARWYGAHALASVRYLAFLDQDDVWRPDFLARTVRALEADEQAVMAVTNAEMRTEHGAYRLYRVGRPSVTLDALKWVNTIIAPGQVLLRYDAWREARIAPDLSAPGADDWLMWLAVLARGGRGLYIPDVLVDYREHAGGAHNRVDMTRSERAVVRLWFPRLGLGPWDQRCYEGRVALDALRRARYRKSLPSLLEGLWGAIRDPAAFMAAWKERRRRRRHGFV